MTPDVVVDVGNSRVKWGRVHDHRVAEFAALHHDDSVQWKRQAEEWQLDRGLNWVIAGVHPVQVARAGEWVLARGGSVEVLDTSRILTLPTGMAVGVDDPAGVGVDRLLTALAASRRVPDRRRAFVITVGTATTVDLVNSRREFTGGAILPGPSLMARALHEHTAQLPLLDADADLVPIAPGRNTHAAIKIGIAAAVLGPADHLVWEWNQTFSAPSWVFVTGGGAPYFSGFKFRANPEKVVHDMALTLDGLRLAAEALP